MFIIRNLIGLKLKRNSYFIINQILDSFLINTAYLAYSKHIATLKNLNLKKKNVTNTKFYKKTAYNKHGTYKIIKLMLIIH